MQKISACLAACALLAVLLLPGSAAGQSLETGIWKVLMVSPKGEYQKADLLVHREDGETLAFMKWRTGAVKVTGLKIQDESLRFSWNPYFEMDCRFERVPSGQYKGACLDANEDIGAMVLAPPGSELSFSAVDVDKAFEVFGISKEEYIRARNPYPPTQLVEYEELPAVPAKIVEVDGRDVNVASTGSGSITVVLESGIGDDHSVWQRVQSALSNSARVVSYDRAGLGLSDASAAERSPRAMAHELRAALIAAGERAPYVLVAHQAGAFTIRSFVENYPDEVAGLVFIEPSHEREDDALKGLDERSWQEYVDRKRSFLSAVSQASAREFAAYLDVLESWDDRSEQLSDGIPVVVLSGRRPVEAPGWIGETVEGREEMSALHRRLAEQLGGRLVPAANSGAHIHLEQPELVVSTIQDVLQSAQNDS